MTKPLAYMDDDDVTEAIRIDEQLSSWNFAHAAERALTAGQTVYNFEGKPATITKVRGRRFIYATSDAYPEPSLIDWRYFSLTPAYDPNDTLVEYVVRFER